MKDSRKKSHRHDKAVKAAYNRIQRVGGCYDSKRIDRSV